MARIQVSAAHDIAEASWSRNIGRQVKVTCRLILLRQLQDPEESGPGFVSSFAIGERFEFYINLHLWDRARDLAIARRPAPAVEQMRATAPMLRRVGCGLLRICAVLS